MANKKGLIGNLFEVLQENSYLDSLKNTYIGEQRWTKPVCLTPDGLTKKPPMIEMDENPTGYFQIVWLGAPYADFSDDWYRGMQKNDYIKKAFAPTLRDYISDESFYEKLLENELPEISDKEYKYVKEKILRKLVSALENTSSYGYDRNAKNTEDYRQDDKDRLKQHIELNKDLFELPHFIRWYLLFAITKSLPDDFSKNLRTKRDLKDFTENVIAKYGCTSPHAKREIIRLARQDKDKDNSIAKYEYADLLYFGAEGIKQDIPKAYLLYREAAAIEDGTIRGGLSNSNPLALWSLAYISFNYKNPTIEGSLSEYNVIPDLDLLSFDLRIKRAFNLAKQAYIIAKLPCAANTLGLIKRFIFEDIYIQKNKDALINENIDIKKIVKLQTTLNFDKTANEYFQEAANGGFVFANNNLAEEQRRMFIKNIEDPQQRTHHLDEYIRYLNIAADLHDAYALHKLGRFYNEGISVIDERLKHAQLDIPYKIDEKLAYDYFRRGYKSFSEFAFDDKYVGWCCAHLKRYFSKELEDEFTQDQRDDIDRIIDKYSNDENLRNLVNGEPLVHSTGPKMSI